MFWIFACLNRTKTIDKINAEAFKMDFLSKYIEEKRKKGIENLSNIQREKPIRDFVSAISGEKISIIAEIKKSSPSSGVIKDKDAVSCAIEYQEGGADAISVLTEQKYFKGDIKDLKSVSQISKIPVLRKDFIIHKSEIYESYINGADAFLLISECFTSPREIEEMILYGRKLGIEPLLEFFSEEGGEKAIKTSAKVIGINNRNLNTLDVDLKRGIELFKKFQNHLKGRIVVSESGIKSKEDILIFVRSGINKFLIGETLMRSQNPGELIKELKNPKGFK